MSEISELTKKIDAFILKFSPVIGSHTESIKTFKGETEIIKKTLYNGKNGITVKVKGIETFLKGKQSTSTGILSYLTAIFMGGIFILWIIKTINQL